MRFILVIWGICRAITLSGSWVLSFGSKMIGRHFSSGATILNHLDDQSGSGRVRNASASIVRRQRQIHSSSCRNLSSVARACFVRPISGADHSTRLNSSTSKYNSRRSEDRLYGRLAQPITTCVRYHRYYHVIFLGTLSTERIVEKDSH